MEITDLNVPFYNIRRCLNFLEYALAFQHTVGYAHPTVYKLINSMRLEQPHTENLKAKIDAGQKVVRKNQKYVRVTSAIRRLADNFNQREPLDYLRDISHNIELNV